MGQLQLVICGSVAIDRIMNFSGRYRDIIKPDKLHAISVSTLLDKMEDTRGGIGANISANLAVLGDKPILVAAAGNDARDYMADLAKAGVDITYVHYSELPTASFNVITDSEDSQVGGFFQGAMADSDSLSLEPFRSQETVVMVAPNNPEAMNREVKQAHDFHMRLFYDPGQQVTDNRTDLAAGVDAAEVLFVNDYEMGLLTHRIKSTPEQIKKQVPLVITTLGRDGSLIEGTNTAEQIEIGIAQPATITDPTGAGDAYRAGFLYGYLRKWELRQCGQLGATLASFIVERRGTLPWFSKDDVTNRYQENFNEEIKL